MNSGLIDINYIKKIKDICKKISYEKIFDFYFFLFIFTTINREFSFFGIDLRYVLVILSLGLIAKKLFKKKFCITNFKKNNTLQRKRKTHLPLDLLTTNYQNEMNSHKFITTSTP